MRAGTGRHRQACKRYSSEAAVVRRARQKYRRRVGGEE